MATLNWSDDFALGVDAMDTTHQEFIALLAQVQAAPDDQALNCWRALVAHTQEHFDSEDRYMLATGFAATNCHTTHHKMILDVLRQGLSLGEAGDLGPLRQMAEELTVWFPIHADSMDAALAMHLKRVGFDPATGQMNAAQNQPDEAIHGCGGACETPAPAATPAAAS